MKMSSLKKFSKMYDTGGVPQLASPNAKSVAFLGYFFRAFQFPAPSPFLPVLPVLSPNLATGYPLPFQSALPSPKEVNKKLSYGGQNALSVIKTHERNNDSEHILYLYVRQCTLAGRNSRPIPSSVRLSVCSFVRLSVTNLWTLYFETEWTDLNANWHKSSPRAKDVNDWPRGQEVKGQGHRRPKLYVS